MIPMYESLPQPNWRISAISAKFACPVTRGFYITFDLTWHHDMHAAWPSKTAGWYRQITSLRADRPGSKICLCDQVCNNRHVCFWQSTSACPSVKQNHSNTREILRAEFKEGARIKLKKLLGGGQYVFILPFYFLCCVSLECTVPFKKPDAFSTRVWHIKNRIHLQWWLCDLYKIRHLLPTK